MFPEIDQRLFEEQRMRCSMQLILKRQRTLVEAARAIDIAGRPFQARQRVEAVGQHLHEVTIGIHLVVGDHFFEQWPRMVVVAHCRHGVRQTVGRPVSAVCRQPGMHAMDRNEALQRCDDANKIAAVHLHLSEIGQRVCIGEAVRPADALRQRSAGFGVGQCQRSLSDQHLEQAQLGKQRCVTQLLPVRTGVSQRCFRALRRHQAIVVRD